MNSSAEVLIRRSESADAENFHACVDAVARVSLEVYDGNPRAIALYRRFGFEHEGVKRAARAIDGRVEEILRMAILFRDPATLGARLLS